MNFWQKAKPRKDKTKGAQVVTCRVHVDDLELASVGTPTPADGKDSSSAAGTPGKNSTPYTVVTNWHMLTPSEEQRQSLVVRCKTQLVLDALLAQSLGRS